MKGRVLIIAGSDSGGGAGIQADIKTVTALGAYAATAITALTAQNTIGVQGILPVSPDFVRKQIESVLGLFDGVRRDRGDALAHEARAVLSQNGDVPIAPAVKDAANVIAGQDGVYTLRSFGPRCVNAHDPRVRVRAAQGLRP